MAAAARRARPILTGPANQHGLAACAFRPNSSTSCARAFWFRRSSAGACGSRRRAGSGGDSRPSTRRRRPRSSSMTRRSAWFDFSSGKNGNIFDFVMMTEGLTFPEAVERLAGEAGLPLPTISREEEARDERRKTLNDVMELAAKFFEATLASRAGAKARGYLADRGLDPATQVKFRLGYAPAEALRAQGASRQGRAYRPPDMVEAGLLVAGDDIPVPYDRFRDRVMFPITDLRGRVIAFGGRALEKDAQAKYLNSPETPLFHKGATLYNIAAARAAAHKGAPVIAVEGYVDVIAMVTAGFEATVAPLGTALTADQLVLLWKMADEPTLCFDGDSAGRRAAYRAVDLALPLIKAGKSLKFASLPEGHDPDDLVRAGGREAISEVIGARATARPCAVDARDRGRRVRYPGTACGIRGADRRGYGGHRRRSGAQILSPRVRRPAAADVRCRRRAAAGAARSPAAGRIATGEWRTRKESNFRHAPVSLFAGRYSPPFPRRTLCGGERATGREPGSSRPPGCYSAARSADPAGRHQPPLASARSSGGARRRRVSARRGRPGEERADRHLCPWRRERWRGYDRGTWSPRADRSRRPHRAKPSPRLRSGARSPRRRPTTFL